MRATNWKRLAGPALEQTGADWCFRRALAYMKPVDWIVHGVLAEDSASRSEAFYLWVVRLPLFVPLEGVVDLSWSDRFGGASTTYSAADSDGLKAALTGAASAAMSLTREEVLVLDPPGGADNVRMQETRAYGLALAGDDGGALEVLRRVQRHNASYPWEHELLARAGASASLIESGQLDDLK